ncbi:MAG: hypothetical protein RR246_03350, partial [Clostridia bacterium]
MVGYIEPHSRPQTAALLDGLESIPTKAETHNKIIVNEFDLDMAVKRNP